jgi:transcriptional regulator with XRE-family HTH domain
MSEPQKVHAVLRRLRDRAGLSREDIGRLLGMPATTFQTYDTSAFKRQYLPIELVKKLAEVLPGRGDPPIDSDEVWALAGVAPASVTLRNLKSTKVTAIPSDLNLVPTIDGIAEMEVIGGLGSGGQADLEDFEAGNGHSISADVVRDTWSLPPAYLAGELRITSKRARIIEVRGDSMEPTLLSGDRVMIDVGDRGLSQEGVFALWDGDGVAVKRLERVRPSDPPSLRLISDNPRHRAVELTMEEVQIIGRVIWVARKI